MKKKNCYFSPPISSGGQRLHSQWLGSFVRVRSKLLFMLLMLFTVLPSAFAASYITELKVLGKDASKDIEALKEKYKNLGWTIVNKDLNTKAGGYYVYLAYKTSDSANPETGYITDIVASTANKSTLSKDGRTYTKVSAEGFDGDLNKNAGGEYIYLYYTTSRKSLSGHFGTKRVISSIDTSDNSNSSPSGGSDDFGPICWAETFTGACDVNKNAGGDYIYVRMHFREQTLAVSSHPAVVNNLVYNGQAQKLMTAPSGSNWGVMRYQVDNGDWTTSLPVATEDGNHTVKYYLYGGTYANSSSTTTKTVNIAQPSACPTNLQAQFKQAEKQVVLTWNAGNIPGNFTKYKWVVYRGDTKLKAIDSNATRTYTDTGYTNESDVTYNVYYVANEWGENTKKDEAKVSVKVNTTRKVPVNNLKADVQTSSDRVILTWSSVGYKLNWGNKFNIYVDKETEPIITIKHLSDGNIAIPTSTVIAKIKLIHKPMCFIPRSRT